jgi:hypothetical protein
LFTKKFRNANRPNPLLRFPPLSVTELGRRPNSSVLQQIARRQRADGPEQSKAFIEKPAMLKRTKKHSAADGAIGKNEAGAKDEEG